MRFTGPMKYNLKAMGLAVGRVLTEHVKSQSSSSRNACLSFQSVCTVKKWIKINVINKKKKKTGDPQRNATQNKMPQKWVHTTNTLLSHYSLPHTRVERKKKRIDCT